MKRPITTYTFDPDAGTLDLSGISGFDVRRLFAVIHLPSGERLFAPTTGQTYASLSGSVLRLQASTTGLSSTDPLLVLYDDGGKPAEDGTLATGNASLATLATNSATLGQKAGAGSVPVVLSSDGPFASNFGLQADAAAASDGATASFVSLFKRSLGYLATLAGAVSSGSLKTTPAPLRVTPINRSGSVTLGGTAQTIATANPTRLGFCLQNLSTADLWLNTIGAASAGQPSWWVPPGAEWSMPSTGVSTGDVSLYGGTTGQTFSAREW